MATAAPIPPQGDVTMMFMPTMGHRIPKTPVGGAPDNGMQDIQPVERTVRNDPRESFYWTLPNKLTPQQCLQMLRAALAGDLFQQFNLCQLMLDTWPTFRMASHQLMESAAYMRYAVHPFAEEGKKPSKRAMEKADLVSRAMRSMEPNPFNDELGFSGMVYKTCDAMLNGISLTELLWTPKASSDHGREWLPTAAAWVHPRHFTFSTEGNIALFTDDSDRINSGVLGYRPGMMPDMNKFICGQFISRAGSSLGAGFMRPLVWYWAARQFNNEWMLNTAKQYGSPFIDITYRTGSITTGPGSDLEKLNEMLKTAGPQRRLLHPEGTTAEIHQPSSLGKENPQRVLEEKADEACLFLLLGQKGTTTSVSGQLGNDDSHENVKEERKLGLANWVARNPLRQFARAVLNRNYGNSDECPNIEPDTTKPLKPEQVGQMATAISTSKVPVRADEFYKKIGFTQPDEGEMVLTGGILGIQGKALTDEERFDQQLGQQAKQAEVQMELQAEAAGAAPAQATEGRPVKINVVKAGVKKLREALWHATDEELAELEDKLTAAEQAAHRNGEITAVELAVHKVVNRIKF
jgi:phage gp29-like protein